MSVTREMIESWVKEALACKDQVYQLVEVCRTVQEIEREECAKIADRYASYNLPSPPEFDRGHKVAAGKIAGEIRGHTITARM